MPDYGTAAPDANVEIRSKFRLEIDGIAVGAFEAVKLGELKWGEITNRTGIDDLKQGTSTGLQVPTDITVKKMLRVGGIADIKQFYTWWNAGSTDRRSGAVVLLDRDDTEIDRVNFRNAFVLSISEIDLEAISEADAVEWEFTLRTPGYDWA